MQGDFRTWRLCFAIEEEDTIVGTAVINKTGMGDYVAENFLVFIAIQKEHRNKGLGTRLLKYAQQYCKGGFCLHCKPNDKAMAFFRSAGFTTEFIEMRYKP